jgi:hypothetical protein
MTTITLDILVWNLAENKDILELVHAVAEAQYVQEIVRSILDSDEGELDKKWLNFILWNAQSAEIKKLKILLEMGPLAQESMLLSIPTLVEAHKDYLETLSSGEWISVIEHYLVITTERYVTTSPVHPLL